MARHKCAAEGCEKKVPTEMLMCRVHWFAVPKLIRDRVWAAYRNLGNDLLHASNHGLTSG